VNLPTRRPLHDKIIQLLLAHPDGLTIFEIRDLLGEEGKQEHVNRRVRELRAWYHVPLVKGRYVLKGELSAPIDTKGISGKLRAAVIHRAHGKCQMCGKPAAADDGQLEADHKIPRSWGGETSEDNLWAICRQCNNGKRNFFASFDPKLMSKIVATKSVYERIATVLKLNEGKPVASWLLEFVANVNDFQEDWQKRLRELRYPVIGMKIRASTEKAPSGKRLSSYTLEHWVPLPPDHQALIKQYERDKKKAKGAAEEDDD
jgi:hypothetical protein